MNRGMLALGAVVLATGACSVAQIEEFAGREDVRAIARVGRQAVPIGVEKEREIGFGIAATVAGRYGLVDDPELARYVNLVGQAVAQQSSRYHEVPFRFGVLDTDDVNAFAAPGGYVFVTRGALAVMESEAELAAVLAHEVAHVDEKHVLEEIRRSAVMEQARDESDLEGRVLDRISEAGSTLLFTGLSREDEMESDSLAVLYAGGTGYAREGMLDFLRHLAAAEDAGSSGMREWVATHPSTGERMEALGAQLDRAGGEITGADGAERFRRHVRGG